MPTAFVYAQKLITPIAACTVPIMIGATVAALQGESTWEYLVWGLPLALASATAWTQFTLSTTPAEIHLRNGQCAVRSVHDVLHGNDVKWNALYDIRESSGEVELFLGWTAQVCRREEWPDYADLSSSARRAVQERLSKQTST